jgi:predicted small secreted protein
MLLRIVFATLVSLAAMTLSGCANMNCGAGGDSHGAGGGCRAHTTF